MSEILWSQDAWDEAAIKAQELADERREIEWERNRRLLPFSHWLEWVGVFVVIGIVIFMALVFLWCIGSINYDPAFSGR